MEVKKAKRQKSTKGENDQNHAYFPHFPTNRGHKWVGLDRFQFGLFQIGCHSGLVYLLAGLGCRYKFPSGHYAERISSQLAGRRLFQVKQVNFQNNNNNNIIFKSRFGQIVVNQRGQPQIRLSVWTSNLQVIQVREISAFVCWKCLRVTLDQVSSASMPPLPTTSRRKQAHQTCC